MRVLVFPWSGVGMLRRGFFLMIFRMAVFMGMLVAVGVFMLMTVNQRSMRMLVRMFMRVGVLVLVLVRLFRFHNVTLRAM